MDGQAIRFDGFCVDSVTELKKAKVNIYAHTGIAELDVMASESGS